MPRIIDFHKCEEAPSPIEIVADELNDTNRASHKYVINVKPEGKPTITQALWFQKGAVIPAGGWNGITDEALLAIVIDRLICHNRGPWPNSFTEGAALKCVEAMELLHARKRKRAAAGVQGMHAPIPGEPGPVAIAEPPPPAEPAETEP